MNLLSFVLIVLVISLSVHLWIKRFWLGVIIGTLICGAVELVSEILTSPSDVIRPVDVMFWGPFIAIQGAFVSFPIVTIVGIAFYLIRKRFRQKALRNK